MISKIRDHLECFFKLDEFLSNLDLLVALAEYALTLDIASRPKFDEYLLLGNAFHPFIDNIDENPLNELNEDMSVIEKQSNFPLTLPSSLVIITGANMSGKSSLLKKIGCLHVLSQLGSFLPASNCTISLKKNILSQSSGFVSESISVRKSSFELEIAEIDYIIKNLNSNSLILIDELCRSTNYYEGFFCIKKILLLIYLIAI